MYCYHGNPRCTDRATHTKWIIFRKCQSKMRSTDNYTSGNRWKHQYANGLLYQTHSHTCIDRGVHILLWIIGYMLLFFFLLLFFFFFFFFFYYYYYHYIYYYYYYHHHHLNPYSGMRGQLSWSFKSVFRTNAIEEVSFVSFHPIKWKPIYLLLLLDG